MDGEGHANGVAALVGPLLLPPGRLLDGLEEDLSVPAVWQASRPGLEHDPRTPRSHGHLVQVDPALVDPEERELELRLNDAGGGQRGQESHNHYRPIHDVEIISIEQLMLRLQLGRSSDVCKEG